MRRKSSLLPGEQAGMLFPSCSGMWLLPAAAAAPSSGGDRSRGALL